MKPTRIGFSHLHYFAIIGDDFGRNNEGRNVDDGDVGVLGSEDPGDKCVLELLDVLGAELLEVIKLGVSDVYLDSVLVFDTTPVFSEITLEFLVFLVNECVFGFDFCASVLESFSTVPELLDFDN